MDASTRHKVNLLKYLHGAFVYFIDKENFTFVNEMMNQFDENSDKDDLKTLLIVLKFWKEHEVLKENYERLLKILETKTTGTLY